MHAVLGWIPASAPLRGNDVRGVCHGAGPVATIARGGGCRVARLARRPRRWMRASRPRRSARPRRALRSCGWARRARRASTSRCCWACARATGFRRHQGLTVMNVRSITEAAVAEVELDPGEYHVVAYRRQSKQGVKQVDDNAGNTQLYRTSYASFTL